MDYFIGVDLGTTGCKATLFDTEGRICSNAYVEYDLIVISDKIVEQDANDWWNLTKRVIHKIIAASCVKKEDIKSLSVCSQGISFVAVDKNCLPLGNAISWLDTRAETQLEEILENFDAYDLYRITGKRPNTAYVLPKILWLKQNEPQLYKNTFKFALAHDYIVSRMTGRFVTDHTMAAGTMLYDINNLCWSRDILEMFGLDPYVLPEIMWPGEPVGYLQKKAAQELGLHERTLVCVGAQDQKAAALAAGLGSYDATISVGTAGAMEILTHNPVYDSEMSIPCFPYVVPDQWVLEAVVTTAGASLKWLKNTLFEHNSYKEMDELCRQAPCGSNNVCFYPFLNGINNKNISVETKGVFSGLTLYTLKTDILRSVYEGVAYQFKMQIEKAMQSGEKMKKISVFGGGSRSDIWCEIIAGITGTRLTAFISPEIASLGAGILAARGYGAGIKDFGHDILSMQKLYEPEEYNMELYEIHFNKYMKIGKCLI